MNITYQMGSFVNKCMKQQSVQPKIFSKRYINKKENTIT